MIYHPPLVLTMNSPPITQGTREKLSRSKAMATDLQTEKLVKVTKGAAGRTSSCEGWLSLMESAGLFIENN